MKKRLLKIIGGSVLGIVFIGGAYAIASNPDLVLNAFGTEGKVQQTPATPLPPEPAVVPQITVEGGEKKLPA